MNKILKHLTAIVLLLTLGTTAVLAQDPEQEEDILKQAKQQYTLYRNYFKQKQYAEAYPYWQFVVEKRPMLNENLYVNGPVLLYDLIKKTQDPAQKQRLIDTLMLQYDLRLKYFGKGKEGLIYGKKAIEISSRYPSKEYPDSVRSAMELYNKALDFDGANTAGNVINGYFQTSEVYMQKFDPQNRDIVLNAYDRASDLLELAVSLKKDEWGTKLAAIDTLDAQRAAGAVGENAYNDQSEKLKKDTARIRKEIKAYEDARILVEKRFEPYADCEALVTIYQKKYDEGTDDAKLMYKIIKLLSKKKCTDNDLFFKATENFHRLSPSPQSAFLMGSMSLKKSLYADAINYLKEAAEKYEDKEDKAKALLLLAEAYKSSKEYANARSTAYKYASLKPGDGHPYILIGDLYMATAGSCGGDNNVAKRAVYWAAYDKYAQAARVDPDSASDANSRMAKARSGFPSKEDIFFLGVKEGSSYPVGCWINETTTVRGNK